MSKLKYVTLLLVGTLISSASCELPTASKEETAKAEKNKLEVDKLPDCAESTLHKFVRSGDSNGLSKYIADGGSMYEKDCLQQTALHVAIIEGKEQMVSNLLEHELNLTKDSTDGRSVLLFTKDSNGNTPIMLAIERDNAAIAAALVESGIDVNDWLDSDNSSLLHFAASKGSPNSIRWLVEQGLDVNETDSERQWIPLHHAVFNGKLGAAKVLLDLDSCNSCPDKWGFTPIARAIQRDDVDLAVSLVESGADITQRLESNNISLLHFAASTGGPKSIQWLVSKGLNVNETDTFRQWIPLHHAIFHGKQHAAKVLLDLKSCINCKDKWGFTPLMHAIQRDDVATAAALIKSGADLYQKWEPDNITLLHIAAVNGGVDSIRWLVDQGLSVNETDGARQWIPLHHAIFHGNHPAINVLLQLKSCNNCKDKWGFTPLMRAVQRDDTTIVDSLKESGADLNERLESNDINLLHFAAANGSTDSIRLLVRDGLNVNATDDLRKWTPLHHAIFHGKLEAVKVLLDLKSCNNCTDKWGFTPLMRAVHRDGVPIVEALAESGADLNQRLLSDNITLLHFAASSGSPDSIKWLLKHDMKVNAVDGAQRIPLHHAADVGKLQSSRVLVDLGSCINCVDKEGLTPLSLARRHNHQNVVEYLTSIDGKEK